MRSIEKSEISSRYDEYCEGALNSGNGDGYVLGVNYCVAKVKKSFAHNGSQILDNTNAFDLAETTGVNLGQTNMITVSSFCGPRGFIWGYDLFPAEKKENKWNINYLDIGEKVNVLDIDGLNSAFEKLTGSVKNKRFPLIPGTFLPCALKSITEEGKCVIYVAQGIGIPIDREKNACVIMEDFGFIPSFIKDYKMYFREILVNLCKSVLQIGKNQEVDYREIFIGIKEIKIKEGEIGCALVANPYLKIAKNAFPDNADPLNTKIDKWEALTKSKFLNDAPKMK